MMKFIKYFLFLFIVSNSAFATNVCNTSCEIVISFPNGGSIEATEPLSFLFGYNASIDRGETGTINTAIQPADLDFSSGDTLALTTNESITFDTSGSLNLGTGGNFDFTSILIDGDVKFTITTENESDTVYISTMTINGSLIIEMVRGNIHFGSDTNISVSDNLDITTNQTDSSINCDSPGSSLNITSTSFSSTIDSSCYDGVFNVGGEIQLNPDLQISFPDIISIIVDGKTCVLVDYLICETASGLRYELVNDEWTEVESTGTNNPFFLLVFICVLFNLRKRA